MKDCDLVLTDAQLKAEIEKCEYCEEKPCREACPAHCSPADFIMAARCGRPSDYKRAAYVILKNNPFGGVCGLVCPDTHCMKACVHKKLDGSVRIPAVQATIIAKARELGVLEAWEEIKPNGKRVAILGAGPSGLSAAAFLARKGYEVDVYDAVKGTGGMCAYIPDFRLSREMLKGDVAFISGLGKIAVKAGQKTHEPDELLKKGYAAVLVATGLREPFELGIDGEKAAVSWKAYLEDPKSYKSKGAVVLNIEIL